MKKTLNIDEHLLREAKKACQATTDTDTVRLGLEALVRYAAYQRLRSYLGSEPNAKDVPRRREKAARSGRLRRSPAPLGRGEVLCLDQPQPASVEGPHPTLIFEEVRAVAANKGGSDGAVTSTDGMLLLPALMALISAGDKGRL